MAFRDPGQCPIPGCEKDVKQVNNHVRMSVGNGHGPAQQYPDGYDPDSGEYDPENATDDRDDPDDEPPADLELADADEDDDRGDGPEPVPFEIEDGPDDMRSYGCPSCDRSLDHYGADECPDGHTVPNSYWTA